MRTRLQGWARGGVTLIELLGVMVIIFVLVAMLIPAVTGARNMVKKRRARAEVGELVKAWNSYCSTYSDWRARLGSASFEMEPRYVRILQGEDSAANPYGIQFMKFDSACASVGFRDPWARARVAERRYKVDLPEAAILRPWFFETRAYPPNRKGYEY